MPLRLLGGRFKSRLIKTPKTKKTRPTSSILRKAVFDISQELIEGATFLDLFAGSGAMGLEAISRGADKATFVENDKEAIRCIYSNIETLGVEHSCEVLKLPAMLALKKLREARKTYEIIYVDPPYDLIIEDIFRLLDDEFLLAKDGLLFLEQAATAKSLIQKTSFDYLQCKDSRKFGGTILYQFINARSL
ncbi:MAG: 16S rRNA (guanine(966)-N(2))-methyltransferase RsmD [Anaerolineae bacterium]